jgi:hypothetical protein
VPLQGGSRHVQGSSHHLQASSRHLHGVVTCSRLSITHCTKLRLTPMQPQPTMTLDKGAAHVLHVMLNFGHKR